MTTDTERPARVDILLFLAISAGAWLVRYAFLLEARAVPIFDALLMDGESYGAWSDRIVAGDWLGTEVFYQAPLYPYFLAVVKLAFGDSLWTIRLVQITLGALSCGVLYLAGRAFFSRRVGVVAGALLALYPPAIFFDALIQKANLGLVWMVLLLWLVARAIRAPGFARFVAAGAVLGLMMLTREETILLVPVLLATTLLAFREESLASRALWASAWLVGLALVLAPVAARNAKVGGEFVLTTSQAGPNFYIGNGPRANGTYVPLVPGRSNVAYERQTAVDLAQQDLRRELSPKEVSDYWRDKALAHIRENPGRWTLLLGRKLALLANAYEMPDAEDQYFYERYVVLLRVLGRIWHYGILLPLAAAGIVLTWRRRRELLFPYAMLATLAGGVLLFYVFARYRYPIVPILVLFAAAALVEGVAAARAHGLRGVRGALVVVALVAVLANWPLFSRDFQLGESLNNSGIACAQRGDDEAAVLMFRAAIEKKGSNPELHGNLAISLERLGRSTEAIVEFRRALALRPGDPRSEFRLGRALSNAGETQEGVALLRRALQRNPANTEGAVWLSDALVRADDPRAALDVLRDGLKTLPQSTVLRKRLAWRLATLEDPALRDGARAVGLALEAVAKTGERDAEALDVLGAAYAETGDFDRAIESAEKALAAKPDPALAHAIAQRLERYRERTPWREDGRAR